MDQTVLHPVESITYKTVPGPVSIITGYFFFDFEFVVSLFCFFPVTDFTEPPMETSSRLSVSDSSSLKSGSQENCP